MAPLYNHARSNIMHSEHSMVLCSCAQVRSCTSRLERSSLFPVPLTTSCAKCTATLSASSTCSPGSSSFSPEVPLSLILIQSRVCLHVIVTSQTSGIAIVGLTCSEYAIALFFNDDCGPAPETIRKTLAAAILS